MTLTATRNEDVGFIGSLFAAKPKTLDPTALVNTALAGFQAAADNLVAAQDLIATQKAEHLAAMEALSGKVTECTEQHSRLSRIQERLSEFLA